jgi:heme/copper-type cytochrome/quinol oxidase subunit 4
MGQTLFLRVVKMNTSENITQTHPETQNHQGMQGSYVRFFAMIGTSIVVMFFLMYLHSYQLINHALFSETRVFMALIMGAAMMVIMLSYMLHMYKSKTVNIAIYIGAIVLFGIALWLVRSQVTVSDVDYMEGMVPHHSIAILTSERAQIEDIRVRELADRIIVTQRQEIKEMKWLIEDIRENGLVTTQAELEERPLPEFEGSV